MAECGDGDSSNGRPYRTHDTLWTFGSSMRRAVQGPMTDYGPGSSNGMAVQGPMTHSDLAAA
ncbi:unnamed protein product [Staurois parvus]|uniref:Uncharacterized protein n=1 Tax=Staurois parvus TaxID=386267 RepID=A0ABN9D752_9NEOB|nr:unnamed protein product [Staurois parvus]